MSDAASTTSERRRGTDSILDVRDVTKRFGGLVAVDGCSLEVEEGTITGLIGPNGAGKSTLFNLICGDLAVTRGEISFRGEPIQDVAKYKRHLLGIGRAYQEVQVFPELTLVENVKIALRPKRLRETTRDVLSNSPTDTGGNERRAHQLLEEVELDHLKDNNADEISYGQRRLLQLAITIGTDCELILLDEPTAGVNPTTTNHIVEFIKKQNENGRTFLIIEHDIQFVMENCAYIHVLHQGTVLSSGTPAEVRADDAVKQAYLGG